MSAGTLEEVEHGGRELSHPSQLGAIVKEPHVAERLAEPQRFAERVARASGFAHERQRGPPEEPPVGALARVERLGEDGTELLFDSSVMAK